MRADLPPHTNQYARQVCDTPLSNESNGEYQEDSVADPFVAEIRIFPFNFAPRGWAWCDGQLLPLSQNTALFSLLGTTYGGDGKSNFALPDLQGRSPMQPGQGPGLSLHDLGETGGSDTVTLLESEIPSHSHSIRAQNTPLGGSAIPTNNSLNRPASGNLYDATGIAPVAMAPETIAPAGGDQPHNNLQPYLTFYFCIALQGVFPPRG
jgi:microcystin-dependent protein